jgi:hypothetical protein
MAELSEGTWQVIRKLFGPEERAEVAHLLEQECGNNLPFLGDLDPYRLERFRYAALKLSGGRMSELRTAIAVAKQDWRDLLVAAGFANSLDAHKQWAAEFAASSNPAG